MDTNKTTHTIYTQDSADMSFLPDNSVDLIVTSPPYPMVKMWDYVFFGKDSEIKRLCDLGMTKNAFFKMHDILNDTWKECDRVLKDGGFICVNIGDAVRNIADNFQLYPNHVMIVEYFFKHGYNILPDIHWRKPTNSITKFMGSGMYPAGAYVTYEHEYILVMRKGGKRVFRGENLDLRHKSAYFWEERNVWFSDLWTVHGIRQPLKSSVESRKRSGSFPLDIPYRLINMYSIENDLVLDPFCGLGTTNIAAMLAKRNSIGLEINEPIAEMALDIMDIDLQKVNSYIQARIDAHNKFIDELPDKDREQCYINYPHRFDVKTKQEQEIHIQKIGIKTRKNNEYTCQYINI